MNILFKRKIITGKTPKIAIAILSTSLILTLSIIPITYVEPTVKIDKENITINGLYGETLHLSEISRVILIDTLPPIKLRTNGISLGKINKGYFYVEKLGNIKLITHSLQKPYIYIETKQKKTIILNFHKREKTNYLYTKLNYNVRIK